MRASRIDQGLRSLGGAFLALTLVLAACSNGRSAGTTTSTTTTSTSTPDTSPGNATTGTASRLMSVRLSQGQSQTAPIDPVPVVEGSPLDGPQLQSILDRLPPFEPGHDLANEFRWPTQTLTPPQTGATVDVPFPPAPATNPVDVPSGPLQVLRFQPDGEVPVAPFISITFNQAMVAVGTLGQLDQHSVPATITPALEGRWQWIGTRTLRFDFASAEFDRLPMATEYTVTVPAGATSATGAALTTTVSWKFATPPVTVKSFQPEGDGLARQPVFVATFDQRVDPQAVLDTVTLRSGGEQVAVRVATAAEINADDTARQITQSSPEGRWLAFRPVEPMPADTAVAVDVGPGTPSAEGPRTTTAAASFSGHTYAPLKIVQSNCGGQCFPGSGIVIEFNNALDPAGVDPAAVHIDPPLAGVTIGASGNTITINGVTQANTVYNVTIPAKVTDVFGQTLGSDQTRQIRIGAADPQLQPLQPLITLDPMAPSQSISVVSINHADLRVRVLDVKPQDWPSFASYLTDANINGRPTAPSWPVLVDTVVDVQGDTGHFTETAIDLGKVFNGKPGHAVVIVESTTQYDQNSNLYWQNRPVVAWVQSTTIGVDAVVDAEKLVAWTTDLHNGAPLSGVSVQLAGATAATDADGLATFGLSPAASYLVASRGDDSAIMSNGFYGGGWNQQQVNDEARWFVFTDRGTYRPGETVKIKGWVRRLTLSGQAQLHRLGADAKVSWVLSDAQGNQLGSDSTVLSALGGFELSAPIPDGANLGQASVSLTITGEPGLEGQSTSEPLQIQEFRRPEFEVVVRPESPEPFVSSRPATLAVDANYYAGGPLAAAPVSWRVTTNTASYSPPDWNDYTFGIWTPWWLNADVPGVAGSRAAPNGPLGLASDVCCVPIGQLPNQELNVKTFTGVTDGAGSQYLQVDFAGADGALPDLPVTVTAEATVTDVNRQAWSSRSNMLVHPADFYVGLRSTRTFVRPGDPIDIDVIVTDVAGKAVAGRPITVTADRLQSTLVDGRWTEVPTDTQTCATTSADKAVTCTFKATEGGTYRITSVVADDHGGRNRTELTRWVSGSDARPARNVELEQLTIVPDKATYAAGDTAELLVQSPFSTGAGLLTVTRNGIQSTSRFTVTDGSAVLQVPIADRDIPMVDVSIEVVGATQRTADDGSALPGAPMRPAFAAGSLTLSIPPVSRTLTVTATPRDATTAPGTSTQIDVAVTDAAGAPVKGAEFSVVVVDEAVLALSGYTLGNPLDAFYGQLYTYLGITYGRSSIVLADPASLQGVADGQGGAPAGTTAPGVPSTTAAAASGTRSAAGAAPLFDAAGQDTSAAATTPIAVRSNFDALALFEPSVTTGPDGKASVPFTLPDTLTRYRVMVVAVSGDDRFGSDESTITARLPLTVRPSAPRFANFGDRFELPVVVQNQTDQSMDVDVTLQTANLAIDAEPDATTGKHVTVPANDRVEVRFQVSAAQAGTARFRVAAVSGTAADAATVELPVYTPATAEAFATYGVIDDGATAQPLLAPTGVVPQFGGLEVTTSSTSLQALTDAVLYISDYRYATSDALASRIMSFAALRPVLEAFDAEGLPTPALIDAAVADDVAALVAMQNDDGGWPYWKRSEATEPFNSIQVAHALVLADKAGYAVPAATRQAALAYLATIENHFSTEYSQETRDALSAYALNVRALAGDRDATKANDLYRSRGDTMQLDAIAWLWPVIDDSAASARIERLFTNRAIETAGAANFANTYGDDAYLIMNSDRRTDGIVLDALITARPNSDLIPKVVNGLLGSTIKGRWDNIQENAFILLALKHYFDAFESQTPDFVARVWLGERFAGEHSFNGRQTDRVRIDIPTQDLIATGDSQIVLAKEGAGRLYYRLGLKYAPQDLRLDPLDRGFVVDRVYEAVDDPADVTRDPDGVWRIKAGARVRVRLTMVAESQRTHVALTDPLPAGLEILNPSLAVSQSVPTDPATDQPAPFDAWWWGTWYDHQNLRDDRAEAFATVLPGGTYTYSYVARATAPGTFVVPPTRAEEIYAPETFGRTATDTVIVSA